MECCPPPGAHCGNITSPDCAYLPFLTIALCLECCIQATKGTCRLLLLLSQHQDLLLYHVVGLGPVTILAETYCHHLISSAGPAHAESTYKQGSPRTSCCCCCCCCLLLLMSQHSSTASQVQQPPSAAQFLLTWVNQNIVHISRVSINLRHMHRNMLSGTNAHACKDCWKQV